MIEQLKKENEELRKEIQRLKDRGAGRKPKFNLYQISNIKNARNTGKSYRELAEIYNCSTSLICKIINDK